MPDKQQITEMVGIEMDVAELLVREAARDLVARYNAYGDAGKIDLQTQLFAPAARFEYRDGDEQLVIQGRNEIAEFMQSMQKRWIEESTSVGNSAYVFHSATTHIIDVEDESHASGQAYVSLLRATGLVEWGIYRDEYVRLDEGWRFARRSVKVIERLEAASE
ncbi:nuclear transport factor 2 family protein [Nocardia sp. 348MFTsu5.1]|uniref:nuclear transport factor 2 family protein n=1 Tax=Nocardia sp. 348MFTsu5.1 TaxID=1172185 RepID=UPI0003A67D67|nr:nuclear transport factor 2 family protein [Nocardia sp. 348MFTsu5.1]